MTIYRARICYTLYTRRNRIGSLAEINKHIELYILYSKLKKQYVDFFKFNLMVSMRLYKILEKFIYRAVIFTNEVFVAQKLMFLAILAKNIYFGAP